MKVVSRSRSLFIIVTPIAPFTEISLTDGDPDGGEPGSRWRGGRRRLVLSLPRRNSCLLPSRIQRPREEACQQGKPLQGV